ncbi:MAG: alpha-glucan family phosphorylase [Acidobacteria bacterium]|nr:alpha-glucan family phosphorylase [Acidobacteriota bacterium]
MSDDYGIAYFSMEIALETDMPTYSGGLGVLAADTVRSAADLAIPMVAVTLLHRKGYFYQRLDSSGWQTEEPVDWDVQAFLEEMPTRASVIVEGRTVYLRAWRYQVKGAHGFVVPVYFLDSDLQENSEWDRNLTHYLYGGDAHYRLCQEVLLGMGGLRILRALGFQRIKRFHMNEGHASLLTLDLLEEETRKAATADDQGGVAWLDSNFLEAAEEGPIMQRDIEAVRQKCVFTTHTPVPAGHDQFPMDLVNRVLGPRAVYSRQDVFCCDGRLNMTYLALNLSHYVNGVAKKHGEISRLMFAHYTIDSITNGVRVDTWTSGPFQELFDRHIPGWRDDNFSLRYALSIPKEEVWDAHRKVKRDLIQHVNRNTDSTLDDDVFTIGFARRATAYKRADLLFHDIDRLKGIASRAGAFQVIFAGKAHPQDIGGKQLIQRICQFKEALRRDIKIAYVVNYDLRLARMLTAGVDLWLNTPQPTMEASGTSGMKAALNGVPSLSSLDGWWIEGHIEGVTGWAIGEKGGGEPSKDAHSLYDKLETQIIPIFYQNRERFTDVMLHCIALNASFFNTQRMLQQYVLKAYYLESGPVAANEQPSLSGSRIK